ncbi:MAG: hypothetical protein B7733_26185 [Myxococcales bacterium FL481]|nr:MAG: hypothetical protein B7733_26185 [Myxococcales bacterium FL481]
MLRAAQLGGGAAVTGQAKAARPRSATRRIGVAAALGLLTTLLLALGHRQVGYVRDEGIYFEASRHYAAWVMDVVERPSRLADRKRRDRAFRVNHEHPALLKLAAGLSARLFATPPIAQALDDTDSVHASTPGVFPVMPEGAAMRLPAQLIAGLGVALLYWVGAARAGPVAGLLAAGSFIALPRVWFHAGLHCFDVPVAVAGLGLVLTYRRALSSPRAAWWLGPVSGLAIATKHNALFAVALCAAHYYAALAWRWWHHRGAIDRQQLCPLPIVALTVVGPLVSLALWPWLWSAPWDRFADYLAFHRAHDYYNIAYLGANYNRPPLPVSYPFVMTWATVPTATLLLATAGLVVGILRDRSPATTRPVKAKWARPFDDHAPWLGRLTLVFAVFPLIVIAWPTIPIFGGTKHWLTAYPFLALACAEAWHWLRSTAPRRIRAWLPAVAAASLVPSLWATIHGHPHNLSQYAPLVGGARGAANDGHCRGFWGAANVPLLRALPREPGGVSLHDMHALSAEQAARDGVWPDGHRARPLSRADEALFFPELHMQSHELQIWQRLGTRRPSQVLTLDDVPLGVRYSRPE